MVHIITYCITCKCFYKTLKGLYSWNSTVKSYFQKCSSLSFFQILIPFATNIHSTICLFLLKPKASKFIYFYMKLKVIRKGVKRNYLDESAIKTIQWRLKIYIFRVSRILKNWRKIWFGKETRECLNTMQFVENIHPKKEHKIFCKGVLSLLQMHLRAKTGMIGIM